MQIIKPLRISCMTKQVADRPRSSLAVTGMVGFDLLDPDVLHTEQAMWETVTQQVGEGAPIDLWMPKQNGEVLLWGKAVAPNNTPLKKMEVGLGLGDIRKTLAVHGRRHWLPGLLSGYLSDAEHFSEMPLSYNHAFGGAGYALCPIGKGYNANRRIDAGETVELPNVEFPDKPILHPDDTPLPTSFMPVDITWPAYTPKGTYDNHWFKHRFPAMPLDFDWNAYNLAPLDQRIAGYFRGDEALHLAGFHADHPLIASSLPGVRMRVFFRRSDDEVLQEIPMVLDTVCLFPSALSGVLLFRGSCEMFEHDGRDLAALMYACEKIDQPRPFRHYEEVFALRTGEDAALHVLSDFQLMPPFSTAVKKRLEDSHDEARQAQEARRQKLDEWLPVYASAVMGYAVPASFFACGNATALPEVPRITPEDIAQGNVDLAAVKKAVTGVADQLLAKADQMRLEADEIRAKSSQMSSLMTKMGRDPLGREDRASLPPEVREKMDAIGLSMRAVADRLEADPEWPLAAALTELAKPSRASTLQAVEQLLDSDDEGVLARDDKLLQLREAMLGGAGNGSEHNLAAGREQQIEIFRQTAAAFLGESKSSATPIDDSSAASSPNDFLQSMGLGAYVIDGNKVGEEKLAEMLVRARAFYETPPEEIGQQVAAAIPRMIAAQPGGENIDLAPIMAQTSALASSFGKPLPSTREMAARMSFDNYSGGDETTVQAQADGKRMLAEQVAQHLPAAVKNGEVDWEEFLGQMGVGTGAPSASAMAGALASLRLDEPAEERGLRRARALALGEPGANRLGFDIPDEHPDEAAALEATDRFLNDPALQSFGNKVMPEMLRGQGDVVSSSGFDLDKLSAASAALMLKHSLTMPPAVAAATRAAGKALSAFPPGVMGGALIRDKIPKAELMYREARQQSPRALLDARDFNDKIALCIGNVIRDAIERGESLAGRDLAGADLRDANLAGVDLRGAFLEHADLSGANLTGARCDDAVFSGARLVNAKLRGASLARANFGGACASGADFTAADMSDAILFEADFTQANLSQVSLGKCNALKANFGGACLDGSRCADGKFIQADLSQASFVGANWHKVVFVKTKMERCVGHAASFRECVLVEAEASGCDFSKANFESAIVMKSDFSGLQAESMVANGSCWQECDLTGARLVRACLQRANFIRAVLDNADLSDANLHGSLLTGASLRMAELDGAQLFETMLRGADLTGAQLRHSNLHCADLENARLEYADLSGARCLQTVLEKPCVRAE